MKYAYEIAVMKEQIKMEALEIKTLRSNIRKNKKVIEFHSDARERVDFFIKKAARLDASRNNSLHLEGNKEYTEEQLRRWTKKLEHSRNTILREKLMQHNQEIYHDCRFGSYYNRVSQAQYAFLRGREFADIEPNVRNVSKNFFDDFMTFGPFLEQVFDGLQEWIDRAKVHIESRREQIKAAA